MAMTDSLLGACLASGPAGGGRIPLTGIVLVG